MTSNTIKEILEKMEALRDTKNTAGMERYGIVTKGKAFGIPASELKKMQKIYKKNQPLAVELWNTGYHEAMRLATLISEPKKFSPELMDKWVSEFYSWDICDSACFHTFRYLPYAEEKIWEYAHCDEEFVRRTAFSLIASLAVGDKKALDKQFLNYLPLIEQYATDSRNFVKKAVNWALRQIGKRNKSLHKTALELAEKLAASTNKTAIWIGKDAARELNLKLL
ncbi:MAG: DNA alkylation repair protein [Bacteroidales bacterium]|jgi:3-methyladenine DNA glycosylase AlkD|nr:DNA alkylation repair protein [Bacteroidales bacterium]